MLKPVLLAACVSLSLSASLALAQQGDDEHASHHPQQGAAGQPGESAAGPGSMDVKQKQLGENMRKIQGLMKQIHETNDAAEKQRLLKEHLGAMRQQMALVRSLGGGMGMMSGGMGMKGKGGEPGGGDAMPMGDKEGGETMGDAQKPRPSDAAKQGSGMMNGGMKGGMMRMHKMMEMRMGMLEMMLEQMLEREAVEAGAEHEH
jgi:hypothetical protein